MTDPIAALQRLGLSKYEAEVFVALQQVDSGTASEIDELADVPRSQVYGAADDLAERGLVDVEHASPKRYRAVSLEEASEQLRRDFEREQERAFDALADLEGDFDAGEERQEAIWTVRGREAIDARVASFVEDAEATVRFAADASLLPESLAGSLIDAADGIDVTVMSTDPPVLERFTDTAVETIHLPEDFDAQDSPSGRMVVVDDRTVLLSVVRPDGEETAFWSSDTDFAKWLIRIIDGHLGDPVDL
jgi:sugar-specific transcriptional regulator TrmB